MTLDAGVELAGEQQPTTVHDPFGCDLGRNRGREREEEKDTRSREGGRGRLSIGRCHGEERLERRE